MTYSYDRTAGSNEVEWVENEILTSDVRKSIDDFLSTMIREGQAVHRVVDRQWEWAVKKVGGGEHVNKKDLVQAVAKHISTQFGEDPLAKAVARAIALGEGLL